MQNLEKDIFYEMVLCAKYGCHQHPEYDEEGICNICMDILKDTYVIETNCGHFYHIDCLLYSFRHEHFKCIECDVPFKKIE